jgi:sulfide:quinone oxidoreductase
MNFNPANHGVAVNALTAQDIGLELALLLTQHSIGFIQRAAVRVDPEQQQIKLEGDVTVDYDFLVIATGPRPAFEEIQGFGPSAHTRSIVQIGDAVEAGKAWLDFVGNPGPIVIGAVQGASNFAAPYEYAMMVDTDLRRRNMRDQVPITYVTSEPYIGHLGVGDDDGDTQAILETVFRDHDISWITNAKVERFEEQCVHVTQLDAAGQVAQTHQLPFKHCMMMPAYTGVDALRGTEGLVTNRGFVVVDEHQHNPNFPTIYAVGVCVHVPTTTRTPVPMGPPKNGYMIESMVQAAAHNIRAQLDGLEPSHKADWNSRPLNATPQVYENGGFDKRWISPVCGLYAHSIWNQLIELTEMEQS